MNEMACAEAEELLAGYAFRALDEEERCAVAEHLAECRVHDVELQALRADMERFAVTVSPVEPPPALRSDLLDAFDREVAGNAAAAPQPLRATTPPAANPAPAPRATRPGLLSFGGLGYALAAALLVVAVGLGAWGASRGDDNGGVLLASAREAGQSMQVTYVQDSGLAVFQVDLGALPEGMAYQAWQIVDDAPVSIGVLTTNSGSVTFTTNLQDASAVALSVEPAGGSEAPTTTPILVSSLHRS